ncbi:MAG: YigZ family protein [Eubacterium sp.]|nr:YigZ family protein [Eubacterium sp.]
MSRSYKAVYEGGVGEIVEKKSRFIATVQPVDCEEEAAAFIGVMKKKYWDASHNCSAFTIGRNHELTRCSDDGEPSGTAGRPMLDVLLREDIHNAAVVVTRYFGGTLLGTGGLVRAYQKSVQEGLAAAQVIEKQPGRMLEINADYNSIGRIQYLLAQRQITVTDSEYTDRVVLRAMVPAAQKEALEKEITEGTSGNAGMTWSGEAEFAVIKGEILIF